MSKSFARSSLIALPTPAAFGGQIVESSFFASEDGEFLLCHDFDRSDRSESWSVVAAPSEVTEQGAAIGSEWSPPRSGWEPATVR